MFDETQIKIIYATMDLVMEKGYSSTTTKDIANKAGINECTIFRKFKGKKDIVLSAMQLKKWNPGLSESSFSYKGNLENDLMSFSRTYMTRVTPQMVKISIGLRTPELYPYTVEGILKVPQTLKKVLLKYFKEMKNVLATDDYESMAMMFLSMNFGFVFLDASFGKKLNQLEKEEYIEKSVKFFVKGIEKNNGKK